MKFQAVTFPSPFGAKVSERFRELYPNISYSESFHPLSGQRYRKEQRTEVSTQIANRFHPLSGQRYRKDLKK